MRFSLIKLAFGFMLIFSIAIEVAQAGNHNELCTEETFPT